MTGVSWRAVTLQPPARTDAAPVTPGRTLDARFVRDPRRWEAVRERVFARTWQLVAHVSELPAPGSVLPLTLLPGLLDEPLLLVRDGQGGLAALSNVCTHRGALLCERPGPATTLRCRYHGRRFHLDGRLSAAPGFERAVGFPEPGDDLPRVPLGNWRGFLFVALRPAMPFADLVADLDRRTSWLPVEQARFDAGRSRDYDVPAHWALYLDNYLEGFHVPFVHAGLAPSFDLPAYRTETSRWGSVQVGPGADQETVLVPPPGRPDAGQRIAGWFFALFPTTLVNVYPWGLSLNLVQPRALDRTTVAFRTWVWDAERLDRGAGSDLHRVELEDESVVASVQRGMASRLWRGGALAPGHEDGLRRQHELLAELLGPDA